MVVSGGSTRHEVNPGVDVVFLGAEVNFGGYGGRPLADDIACPCLLSHQLTGIGAALGVDLNLVANIVVA